MRTIRNMMYGITFLCFVVLGASNVQASSPCDIDVMDYGVIGDSVVDDTDKIRQAIDAAALLDRPTVCFPGAEGYRITDTIEVPAGISLRMDSLLRFDGDNSTPALVIGSADESNFDVTLMLGVRKINQSDWADENSVGIRLYNLFSSKAEIRQASLFTIGVQAIGSDAGFGYNQVELGWIVGNKIGLDLTNENNGWANENIFINGRFGQYHLAQQRPRP